jgi:cell division protease FtsH
VPFFTISGSDFVEMFVGVGASRVRDMFEQAKKQAPCLLFIDEIDAVGRHRGKGFGGGNDEREQTLNQLLVEMDGFEANEGVIVIAATNRPDVLDPALLRPGRFDRQVEVPLPDLNGREQVLKVHMKKVPLGPDVDPRVIARGTPGFSGADLANLVNEGALLAARRNRLVVTMKDLEMAKDKVMMGAERRSFVMTDQERRLTAYHEGGHALVAYYSPAADPIHKATIIPRGRALGLVMQLPETDRVSLTRAKMKADLAVCMAGRVAEELIFGYEQVTSGASSDIRQASRMARAMVMEWGMTETVGPVFYGGEQTDMYLGGVNGPGNYAPTTGEKIDQAVKVFIEEGYQTAKRLLTEHQDALHHLAAALLEYESLTGKEIGDILQGRTIREDDGALHARALSKRLIPSVDEDGVVDEATAQSRDVSAEGDGEKSKKTESRGRRSGSKKEADTDQASS